MKDNRKYMFFGLVLGLIGIFLGLYSLKSEEYILVGIVVATIILLLLVIVRNYTEINNLREEQKEFTNKIKKEIDSLKENLIYTKTLLS